ncbi:MAG: UvrD-helicase domain-containing protein [Bacteroidales bacterium]|nr:UvrD-helicase domain-containing protein [Bacteroidales bacterium]
MSDILEKLNGPQREAVTTIEGPVMVIAGAGSGKTRALTHRIAYMIQQGINPFSIMALTFTNKAAKEMKERIMQLVEPGAARNVWMGTFHSIFARILRIEAASLGYTPDFTIYDTDDSKTLVNNILKEMQLDAKAYPTKYVLHRISMAKSALYTPEDYCDNADIQEQDRRAQKPLTGEIFKLYNARLKRANAMDFDDILFNTNVLLRDFPEILFKYQRHFEYILVDEYQDTNYAQYLIIRRIAAMRENICVVGDDAQSIYSFRGANIQNILNFKVDYPGHKLIRLEQNYRSTKTIVNAANSVIANNKDQIKKNVWSDKEEGELITLMRANSDNEEGTLVANSIFGYKMSRQLNNRDFVILYRTNAQSRSIEEALRKQDIPYIIYGGLSFYDRKEVKDLLAYCRVTINPYDEQALMRIINYPIRGIGETTKQKLQVLAQQQNKTVWDVMVSLDETSKDFNMGMLTKLREFTTMIQSFQTLIDKMTAFELAKHITSTIGLLKVLKDEDTPEAETRVQNVEELLNAIMEFSDKQVDEVTGEQMTVNLPKFMEDVALLTDQDKKEDENADLVTMMTIHSAKGLEFPYVYIVGLEENLFPGIQSLSTREDLEEERRLFYVAITRAETKLILSYAESRYRWGNLSLSEPSRFIEEINPDLIEKTKKASFRGTTIKEERKYNPFGTNRGSWSESYGRRETGDEKRSTYGYSEKPRVPETPRTAAAPQASDADFVPADPEIIDVGQRVLHQKFGQGTVMKVEGTGPNKKASVAFDTCGTKLLMLKFAKLNIYKG